MKFKHRKTIILLIAFAFVLSHFYFANAYYDPQIGRFNRPDPFAGNNQDPQSLHRYLYAHCNPINVIDPSGRIIWTLYHGQRVHDEIGYDFRRAGFDRLYNRSINRVLKKRVPIWGLHRPDLVDRTTCEVYEIKAIGSQPIGVGQLGWYLLLLNSNDPLGRTWTPGISYIPPNIVSIDNASYAFVFPPVGGIIPYQVVDMRHYVSLVTAVTTYQVMSHCSIIKFRLAFSRVFI